VIVLDENVDDDQRVQLRRWRIPVCKIGRDVGRRGMQDPEILPLLRTLRRPTFVSGDRDFFDRSFCSDRYCLVLMDVWPTDVAEYTRRLLRHPAFKTWSQRRGCVVRVTATGILAWRAGARRAARDRWES
jgi:hypothetical protein